MLGVPHRCEEDVEYRGVTIKKDDVVLACEWCVCFSTLYACNR